MKFAGNVARILLCKRCKYGEKICYSSRDTEFFLGDYFFGATCTYLTQIVLWPKSLMATARLRLLWPLNIINPQSLWPPADTAVHLAYVTGCLDLLLLYGD